MKGEPNQDAQKAGLVVRIPMKFERRGGRKRLITPEGAVVVPQPPTQAVTPLVRAMAKAFRWRAMLESGDFSSILELAKAEKVNQSYMCRLLRLTLLAPDLVEAAVDGTAPVGLALARAVEASPMEWQKQRVVFAN